MNIPFSPPDIGENEINEVADTLRSGWITTGPKTKLFEKELAEYCDADTMVCLGSQTASAEMTLRLLGICPGDEVITSAYTYTASASVIYHVGATPVLVDVAPGSYEMDYGQVAKAITGRTKAIIPVDIAGVPCNYEKLYQVIEGHQARFSPANELQAAIGRVAVCADAAHSLGAQRGGVKSGNLADFTTFSFHAVKNLTTGEGGAVTWHPIAGFDSGELYRKYMLLSLHGQSKDALAKTQAGSWEYDIVEPFYKCNMTDISASLGLAQLRRYDSILARRHEIVERYNQAFARLPLEILQHTGPGFRSSAHLYMVRLRDRDMEFRNRVIRQMAEDGIACNVHYKPLPLHTAYRKLGHSISLYPHALEQYQNEITLPLHTLLTNEQVDYIIDRFEKRILEK